MSNREYYFLWTFGPGNFYTWIIYSSAFQFLIYSILSYPAAWIIHDTNDPLKKKKLNQIYALCCLILPTIYFLTSKGFKTELHSASNPFVSVVLFHLILLALWILKLWLLLIFQVYIRKLGNRWGLLGTVITSIICAWTLYHIVKFCLPSFLSYY